jgi:hypothetical protein
MKNLKSKCTKTKMKKAKFIEKLFDLYKITTEIIAVFIYLIKILYKVIYYRAIIG